jgi:diguanylate cyclase
MKSDSDLRQKYRETLERLEAGEARWERLENILRLLIGRLCLAARGRDVRLDSELRRIADLVRRHPEPEEIESSLEPLSRAVAALDEVTIAPLPKGRRSTDESGPASAAGAPGTAARPDAEDAAATGTHPERTERVQVAITAMLERLALLPELRAAIAELTEGSMGSLAPEELAEGLERVARLIGEQRTRLQREKLEIEDMLRQIDSRLEDLAAHLTGEAAEQKVAQESSQQLNLLVLDEVHEINTDVQRAADLPELRGRVRVRLEAINTHLQDFRAREQLRIAAQHERTGRLRVRIAELERESRSLQESLQEEQRLAMVDSLTGIANRAAYDDRIEHEFLRWQRQRAPLSILAWDIDRFKQINDAYGHKAGDKVLRVIGQHLAQHVRGTDFVARYGGEEFVMILVGTAGEQAKVAADKIRTGIAAIGFHFRNKPVTVTASCGITTLRDGDTTETVFDRADKALYKAKDAGRNCCVVV